MSKLGWDEVLSTAHLYKLGKSKRKEGGREGERKRERKEGGEEGERGRERGGKGKGRERREGRGRGRDKERMEEGGEIQIVNTWFSIITIVTTHTHLHHGPLCDQFSYSAKVFSAKCSFPTDW